MGQTTNDAPADTQSRGTNLATLGLLMAAAAPILLIAASLLWDLSDGTAFFLLPAALGLAGAVLIRQRRTVWKVVAMVLALGVAATLFWTAFGLAEPGSFFDFVPGLLVVPGVLLALVAGITSIRSARESRASGPGERRASLAIVSVIGLLALASAGLTLAGRETVDADLAEDADLTVDLRDFEFDESGYEATGETVVLVKNSDPFLHTFTIDALDIDVALNPGSEKLVTLPARPGDYILYCSPHTSDSDDPASDDMAAELTIR